MKRISPKLRFRRSFPKPIRKDALLPARVETEDGRHHFAMLGPGPGGSLRLVAASILLGEKVRVAVLRPGHREQLVGTARVLRTLLLSEGLYENGAAIVMAG